MNQARTTSRVCDVALSRVERLTAMALAARSESFPQRNRSAAYVSIELQAVWAQFVRSFVVSCLLNARSSVGKVSTSVAVGNVEDAVLEATRVLKPAARKPLRPRDEPAWHDPAILSRIATRLSFSNSLQITAALSTGARSFGLIPVYRNFFAHRSRATAKRVVQSAAKLGITGVRHPANILYRPNRRSLQELILDFCADVFVTIDLMR